MNFRIGQKVISLNSKWSDRATLRDVAGPKKDEIVTIMKIVTTDRLRLSFNEYNGRFDAACFKPLDELTNYGINDLIEMLPIHEIQTA